MNDKERTFRKCKGSRRQKNALKREFECSRHCFDKL